MMQRAIERRPRTAGNRFHQTDNLTRHAARPPMRAAGRSASATLPSPLVRLLAVARLRAFQETAIIAIGAFLYFFVRGLMDGQEARAFANADRVIDVERSLGFFWEPNFQEWALRYDWIGTLANWVYIWGHWPVIVGTLVWLLVKHRDHYSVYRNALLISGSIGLVFFVLFPLAPPRFMVDWGFVDTVTLHSNSYRVMQPPSLVNQYAAMPSLHAGWDLLMGIAIAAHASRRGIRAIGYVLPVLMVLAIVLTANHYFMDAVVGSAVALVGLVAARRLQHLRRATARTAPARPPVRRQVALGVGD
jgi:hypothetical protein